MDQGRALTRGKKCQAHLQRKLQLQLETDTALFSFFSVCSAGMEVMKYVNMQICKHTLMDACKYAIIQLCNYAIMPFCKYAIRKVYNHASMHP